MIANQAMVDSSVNTGDRNVALRCVVLNFVLSRIVIFVFIFLVAPHVLLPRPEKPNFRPTFSWSQLALWDGQWYEKIATKGYEFRPDGQEHDISFFPLYPYAVWLLMRTGLPFAVAGTILSNLAFIGALWLLYQRTLQSSGASAAWWAVAAMAWFPISMLCSATYTESLYLLVTLAFLTAFDKQRYWLATILAALTAVCRVPGLTIVPAILIVAFTRRLPWRAYVPAIAACLALAGFLLFQLLRFHDPFAFAHTQMNWEQMSTSNVLTHLYRPNNLFRVLAWPAAVALLWVARRHLSRLDIWYAAFSLALILYSRRFTSIHRFVFGIAPVFIAAGIWLSRRPRLAALAIIVSALALSFESVAWAWDHFVG